MASRAVDFPIASIPARRSQDPLVAVSPSKQRPRMSIVSLLGQIGGSKPNRNGVTESPHAARVATNPFGPAGPPNRKSATVCT
jgi:hypothetical protein